MAGGFPLGVFRCSEGEPEEEERGVDGSGSGEGAGEGTGEGEGEGEGALPSACSAHASGMPEASSSEAPGAMRYAP